MENVDEVVPFVFKYGPEADVDRTLEEAELAERHAAHRARLARDRANEEIQRANHAARKVAQLSKQIKITKLQMNQRPEEYTVYQWRKKLRLELLQAMRLAE